MVPEIRLPANAVRDKRYRQIFNDVIRNKSLLEQPIAPIEIPWDSDLAAHIDEIARCNRYRLFRKNNLTPDFFLIGYNQESMDKTVSFLEALALQGIFETNSFLAEGYNGKAPLISQVNPVTNPRLNRVFATHQITPKGNDLYSLRENQYKYFSSQNEDEVLAAIDCLVRRERDYFLPAILKEKEKQRPVLFLADVVHTLSSNFPIVLNNNGVTYAVWVPHPLKK